MICFYSLDFTSFISLSLSPPILFFILLVLGCAWSLVWVGVCLCSHDKFIYWYTFAVLFNLVKITSFDQKIKKPKLLPFSLALSQTCYIPLHFHLVFVFTTIPKTNCWNGFRCHFLFGCEYECLMIWNGILRFQHTIKCNLVVMLDVNQVKNFEIFKDLRGSAQMLTLKLHHTHTHDQTFYSFNFHHSLIGHSIWKWRFRLQAMFMNFECWFSNS